MVSKAEIALVRSLADKKARDGHGLFVIEGRKMVEEAVGSGFAVKRIFGTDDFAYISGCEVVGRKEIERMSSLRTPQGVLAVVGIPRYGLPEKPGEKLMIALDGVQDPGNLGTIIRLADWFGIRDIICSEDTADCFNPKTVQATMGAVLRVRVHYAEELSEVLESAKETVYGAFLEGENIYGVEINRPESGIVVMGNEGNGVSERVERKIGRKLFIPPYPAGTSASESLNVAMATAIICSEFRRRA